MVHSRACLSPAAWLAVIVVLACARTTQADTLLLAKWDDPKTPDATYSFFGSTTFTNDARWRDHAAAGKSRDGHPHTAGVDGKWGLGLCCQDADNAGTDGNGDGTSKVCGGWFSMAGNFNLDAGTIEFWFKPNWHPRKGENNHVLFTTGGHVGPGTGDQAGIKILWYWHGGGDGRLQAAWTNLTNNADPKHILLCEYQLGEGDFARGTWHHLVISWNDSRGQFFVDGKRAVLNHRENLHLRQYPEGGDFMLGGGDSSIHLYSTSDPANGTYDNFRVSDSMRYDPDRDFTPPGEFTVPHVPAARAIDLGDGVTMEMVLVQPGTFVMGSAQGTVAEQPVRRVTLTRPYYIGRCEVTQAQWQTLMENNPSQTKGPHLPVHGVSWNDCRSFLQALRERTGKSGFRLPTEAEWEYACRAGSVSQYATGNAEDSLGTSSWYQANAGGNPHRVASCNPNAWGIHDMHGNVAEWCHDPFAPDYGKLGASDPVARGSGAGQGHALRGGAWNDPAAAVASAVRRSRQLPHVRPATAGFRCVIARRLWESPAETPIIKPAMVWGDAGGGEVYAQAENCLPGIEHAMTLGLTGIEIDMRPTADGHIVLWHDPTIDDRFYLVSGGRPQKHKLNEMTLSEVKRLRYKATVAGREQELNLVTADEVISRFKGQTNFFLDIKSVPISTVTDLIARHQIQDRIVVGSFSLDRLGQVKAADPRVAVELAAGLLGTRSYLVKAVADLKSIGGEFLACDGWRADTAAYCHQHGIAVRIFGGTVGFGDGTPYLMAGVDGLNGDYPERMLAAVERLWGQEYLPRKGQTIQEVLQSRKGAGSR